MPSLLREIATYMIRVKEFSPADWAAYVAWIGLMSGLFFCTAGLMWLGSQAGVTFPSYVWNLPIGTFIFVAAIAFDTIGHRTIYKDELAKGEALVHHITIAAGIASCVVLSLGYQHRDSFRIPAIVLIALSFLYSLIDEALHWRRYLENKSDRVEMWSHFFIFLGHGTMILTWWRWFDEGYPGVAQTLKFVTHR